MLISLCAEWYETLDSRPRLLKGLPLESLLLGLNGWEVLYAVSVTVLVTASVAAKSRDILISGGNNCYRSLIRRSGFETTVTVDQVGKQSWLKIFKDASLHCISKILAD